MSLSANAVSELPVAAQTNSTATTVIKLAQKRLLTAKADVVQQPEPR